MKTLVSILGFLCFVTIAALSAWVIIPMAIVGAVFHVHGHTVLRGLNTSLWSMGALATALCLVAGVWYGFSCDAARLLEKRTPKEKPLLVSDRNFGVETCDFLKIDWLEHE